MISYFISYVFRGPNGLMTGNGEVSLPTPIMSMQDVKTVTELLRRQGLADPFLMSFTRFDGPTADGGATR
jgi:hypothetical protein